MFIEMTRMKQQILGKTLFWTWGQLISPVGRGNDLGVIIVCDCVLYITVVLLPGYDYDQMSRT